MFDAFLGVFAFLVFFMLVFGFLAFMRYLGYKETLALAEKGLVKSRRQPGEGKETLRWGVVVAALGLALCIGLYPIGVRSDFPFGFGPWMLVGLLPLFFGLGLVLVYYLTDERRPPADQA